MGMVLEKSDRSSTALAERTIGGRKRDIASNEAARLLSYNRTVSKIFPAIREETDSHGCIVI
jgi:hypothetical protein